MRSLYGRIFVRLAATLGVTIAASGFLGSTACVAQNASSADIRTVSLIASLPTLTNAVPLTMLADHFDKAHGIAVDMTWAGGSSSLMVDAVLSGNAEFGAPGAETVLQAIREGANIKIIAPVANSLIAAVINNNAMQKVGVSPSAPIAERMQALRGLTIGTNPVGATYYQMLRSYLKQYGLDPDKDVRLVGMAESGALISGIRQGRFDAIVSASGVVEEAIALKAGTLWFSGARGDFPGTENTTVAVFIARADTIEKHRADVDALRAALTDALNALGKDHAATGRVLYDAYFRKLNPAVWDLAWGTASAAYSPGLKFTRRAYDYWIANDPKGPDSYKNVDYNRIVYAPAQSP
jgi:NitT/TauT family transport system substrate-binding protein